MTALEEFIKIADKAGVELPSVAEIAYASNELAEKLTAVIAMSENGRGFADASADKWSTEETVIAVYALHRMLAVLTENASNQVVAALVDSGMSIAEINAVMQPPERVDVVSSGPSDSSPWAH